MNKYIVHTAIKCSDDNVHRLSYDLTEQTEGSVHEFCNVFKEIEKRFPDTQFLVQQYPDNSKDNFITIFGTDTKESLKMPNAIRQFNDPVSPSELGIEYTENKL